MSNFQGDGHEQGEAFHQECLRALRLAGFEIAQAKIVLEDVGMELDAITNNLHGLAFAWEFKGSLQGKRPGLMRTDTLKKAICNGWLLSVSPDYSHRFPPLFVMTSHKPQRGDGCKMLNIALREGIFAQVLDSRDGERLSWLASADEMQINRLLQRRPLL